jgi:RHS repeat-associated protein
MTTTKSYDLLNRLTNIANVPSADSAISFAYQYNNANQRTKRIEADSSAWNYDYDSLGQVTNGSRFWSDGGAVLGQQFGYLFDDIGNRKSATANGRTQVYTATNNLNQYSSRTVPGYLDVLGAAANTATVTVNATATSRKADYYRAELHPDNSVNPVYLSVTNVAVLAAGTNDMVTNWTGKLFLPKTPEAFGYDLDGNMTNDGRWALTWDAENRLIAMQSLAGAPAGSSNRLFFSYDAQGRRAGKVAQIFTNGLWTTTLINNFIYDGWNLVAEVTSTKAVRNSYVWGLDLSGSMQGAGGVGGLLAITATNVGTHFIHCDGNGNVAALVGASSGATTANYEYDPFGTVMRATGLMAPLNPFRFSTKQQDDVSGLVYYGFRFYSPITGRWLNRDPLGEEGGNVFALVGNNVIANFDFLGLCLAWYHGQFEVEIETKMRVHFKLGLPTSVDIEIGVPPGVSVPISIGVGETLVSTTITKKSGTYPQELSGEPPDGCKWVPEAIVYDKVTIGTPEPAGEYKEWERPIPWPVLYYRWYTTGVKVEWRRQLDCECCK